MSLGDSGPLVDAGGAAIGDDEPPGVRLRYLTKKTIATMTATTKTIMNMSVTQPPQPPQYPLPSHIIAENHLSQPANHVLQFTMPEDSRYEAVTTPAGGSSAPGRGRLCCRGACAGQGAASTSRSHPTCRRGPSSRRRRNACGWCSPTGGGADRRS